MEDKRCSSCTEVKPVSEFNKNKAQKDGYENQCRVCRKLSYQENRVSKLAYRKEYRERNKDIIAENKKAHMKIHGERLYKARYKRDKVNPLLRLGHSIRGSIRQSLLVISESKPAKTIDILGCSIEEFKIHIESLWEPWMNWGNYGNPKDGIYEPNKTWDIDHIIPSATAVTVEDVLALNHHTNLQPLCSYINRFVKRDLIHLHL